jgi:transposase InsO family protein
MAAPRPTTLEERLMIVELAQTGVPDAQIAQQLGWSVATVRKWRQRGRQGRAALVSRMGRARTGPVRAQSPRERALRETVLALRRQHPGWGPKTLVAELARDPYFAAGRRPSRATVARLLRAEGLSRRYQRRVPLPVRPRHPPAAPHEEWELDAKGAQRVPGVGMVMLVDLNDRCSHARLLSYPFLVGTERVTRHLDTEDYQLALRLAFHQWGLPDRLNVDHESIFCDTTSASPFPTRFHLWLVALGIELHFSRVGRPTDQGMTERSHQLWEAQSLLGAEWTGIAALARGLQQRGEFLNRHLPCRSLDERAPLVAYPEAATPRRSYQPAWEAELLAWGRVGEYLRSGHWFRRVSSNRAIRLGDQVYSLGQPWQPGSQAEITYDPEAGETGMLVITTEDGRACRRHPLRGFDKAALMGDLARIVSVPGYQPCLPFSFQEERQLRLCETLTATS